MGNGQYKPNHRHKSYPNVSSINRKASTSKFAYYFLIGFRTPRMICQWNLISLFCNKQFVQIILILFSFAADYVRHFECDNEKKTPNRAFSL